MSRGIPNKLEPVFETIFKNLPKNIHTPICIFYWKYVRLLYKIRVYINEREYTAPLYPFRIYYVSPDKINHYAVRHGSRSPPFVKDGNWDLDTKPFSNRSVHQSFVKRFNQGVDWAETPEYHKLKKSHSEVDGLVTNSGGKFEWEKLKDSFDEPREINDFDDLLKKYDDMFNTIKQEGYETQNELKSINERASRPLDNINIIPEYDEVTIDIARDGTLLWFHGQHRLSLAKILQLDAIPVRIRCRHEQWQKKRDMAMKNPEKLSPNERSHLDIPIE